MPITGSWVVVEATVGNGVDVCFVVRPEYVGDTNVDSGVGVLVI